MSYVVLVFKAVFENNEVWQRLSSFCQFRMKALLGQVSIEKIKDIPLMLCDRPAESDNPCVICVDIVGMIKYYHHITVCYFSDIKINWIFFSFKSILILEKPTNFNPSLGHLYNSQHQRLLAIADEITQGEKMIAVSKFFFSKWK